MVRCVDKDQDSMTDTKVYVAYLVYRLTIYHLLRIIVKVLVVFIM